MRGSGGFGLCRSAVPEGHSGLRRRGTSDTVARARTEEILESLQERGWPLYAAARLKDGEGEDVPLSPAAIVFGNEGAGVSPAFLKMARPLSVRISPAVESLNVAAAAAILLSRSYERRITKP